MSANVSSKSEIHWQQQCVKVLREVTAGDTLGPPQDQGAARPMRKFELSGNLDPAALIDRMIAEKLLDLDDERGVAMAASGVRFLYRYR